MNRTFRRFAIAASLGISTLGFSSAALAECPNDFIAGTLLCETGLVDEDTANAAHDLNGALGRPVDNAIYDAADAAVPGLGGVGRGYAAYQDRANGGGRSGRSNRGGAPAGGYSQPSYPNGGGYQQPGYAPMGNGYAPQYGNGGYAPQVVQTYQCNTQYGSALVGYLMNPGTPCTVMTQWGPVPGIAGF